MPGEGVQSGWSTCLYVANRRRDSLLYPVFDFGLWEVSLDNFAPVSPTYHGATIPIARSTPLVARLGKYDSIILCLVFELLPAGCRDSTLELPPGSISSYGCIRLMGLTKQKAPPHRHHRT